MNDGIDFRIEGGRQPDLILTVSPELRDDLLHDMAQDEAMRAATGEAFERLANTQLYRAPFHTNEYLWALLEPVLANGLSTCDPDDVSALTDAPMLCEGRSDEDGVSGRYWAFMSYQVRSVQQDLAEHGVARFNYGGVGIACLIDLVTYLQDEGVIDSTEDAQRNAIRALDEANLDVHADIPFAYQKGAK